MLAPWKKSYENIDCILKSRYITLLTKVHLAKAIVFPVVMYGWVTYESWNINKSEHQIIDAFELWCWRRLLRVPWTARRSNQSIIKEISPEYSLEGLMLKLKLQYFGWCEELIHWKRPWCWERLKAGGEGDNRGWNGWMISLTLWTWVWAIPGVGDGQGSLACCSPWGRKESYTTEWLNWFICNSRSTWKIIQNLDFFFPWKCGSEYWQTVPLLIFSQISSWWLPDDYSKVLLFSLNFQPPDPTLYFFPYSYVFIFLLSFWRSVPLSKYLSSSISLYSKHCSQLKSQGKEKSVKSISNSYLLFISCLNTGNLFKDF